MNPILLLQDKEFAINSKVYNTSNQILQTILETDIMYPHLQMSADTVTLMWPECIVDINRYGMIISYNDHEIKTTSVVDVITRIKSTVTIKRSRPIDIK